MVKEMSGGSLQIDLQPVGAVVKTSEIGQACPISEVLTTAPTGCRSICKDPPDISLTMLQ